MGCNQIAAKVEQNKLKFKEYLIKQKWTYADMNDQQWREDEWKNIFYGKWTNNDFRNTNGIWIYPNGIV